MNQEYRARDRKNVYFFLIKENYGIKHRSQDCPKKIGNSDQKNLENKEVNIKREPTKMSTPHLQPITLSGKNNQMFLLLFYNIFFFCFGLIF